MQNEFICVHVDGKRRLINLRWVEEIREDSAGYAVIYFAFNCPDAVDQDFVKTDVKFDILSEALCMIGFF